MPNPEHHSNLDIKISQRRWLVSQFDQPRILDCFCGPGKMWELAYGKPDGTRYLGLDTECYDDERVTIVCDSRRYLRHVQVELSDWDIFDLDAYGHPGEHLALITHRLQGVNKPFGFAMTLSTLLGSLNRTPRQVLSRAGFEKHWGTPVQARCADTIWNQFFEHCFSEAGLVEVARQQQNDKAITYYAIYVRPV